MNLKSWVDKKIKKLDWYDVALVKLSSMAFALFVARVWWPLLSLEWHWYFLIFVLAAIRPLYRAYFKK